MNIPFFNLKQENAAIEEELIDAASTVISSGNFILGTQLTQFEIRFAQYIDSKYCLGVGNGLDALILALRALEIGAGDEVIVPAHTFIATWLAVSQVGATIIAIEPDDSYNINVQAIEKHITKNTKAIIPVHLYGRPVDMSALNKIAKQYELHVIEDAAQAQGSLSNGVKCGNLADIAAFSFYPVKNLGALGDAGAITSNTLEIADKIKSFRNYGSIKKYIHQHKGVNSRLDEIQAAVLSVKLKYLDENNQKKSAIAQKYLTEINNEKIQLPLAQDKNDFIAWHQFVLRVKDRDPFIKYMHHKSIETFIHYPVPPHLSGTYCHDFKTKDFPLTEQLSRQVVSIPIYASLSHSKVEYIIKSINEYN